MRRLAFYVDWPDRLAFYLRLVAGLREAGAEVVLVSNKLALHRRARRLGLESRLLRRPAAASEDDLTATREVAAGILDVGEANRLYRSMSEALTALDDQESLAGVVIWNGDDVVGAATRQFALERGRPTLFLEIGNLPGKLFADPLGVNAGSSIARDPSLLDRWPADPELFERWRAGYLASKSDGHVVPQAQIFDRVDALATALNHVGFRLFGVPTDDHRGLLSKARTRWLSPHLRYPLDERAPADGPYLFFPMQVSGDTQVLLNSDLDNFAAIREARRRADDRGLDLVVKPHPAEPERSFVRRLLELKSELGFSLVGGDTFAWLRGASLVVTINSTAGLEAMLLGAEVEFLGRTLYRHLKNPERLASYVTGYLLDIDYFGTDPVAADAAEELLERLPAA